MASFNTIPHDMPDLVDSFVPRNEDDWEDWLRWDPATEQLSPDSSSKDSGDSPIQDAGTGMDTFAWLKDENTINPALVLGDDNSPLDLTASLDPSTFAFGANQNFDPFLLNNTVPVQLGSQNYGVEPMAGGKDTNLLFPDVESRGVKNEKTGSKKGKNARRISSSTSATDRTESQQHSPVSQTHTASMASSLSPQPTEPPKKKAGRKRKSEMPTNDDNGSGEGEPPVKKTSHNVIEKRYRNNLNDKIVELRDSVPSLRAMSKPNGSDDDNEDLEGLTAAHKLNKSTIMAKATEYIRHLEKRNKSLTDDMASLQDRLAALEQAYRRSSAVSDRLMSVSNSPIMDRQGQTSMHTGAIVPSNQSPIMQSHDGMHHRTFAPQSMQGSPQNIASIDALPEDVDMSMRPTSSGGSSLMSKLMVGSMAGLMAYEGWAEHDGSGSSPGMRGLVAAPLHFFKRGLTSTGSTSLASQAILPLFKLSLLLTAVMYLVLPIFQSKPKRKTHTIPQITLTAAPSLASPVEMRRKAWLTAIRSVWTPRHFLIEVVLVGVRMAELSIRRLVGFDQYADILGMSKEDEAVRIKAWDIAIDAQLAGGDAEVSYYRLLLTLMASGTLPDSPIRLMQKAVHFRIFFWEVANAGYGNLFMFKDFTAKVAKIYWDSARNQHMGLVSGTASKVDELNHTIELLPDHLAALIELECDEVLTDDMIQRAYNLAWNRPSAENTEANSTLDKVVEDPAIRSPLDAIAAWFTNSIVDEALSMSVEPNKSTEILSRVSLATKTSPPASSTLTRALVAKAVLLDDAREDAIAAALESMPHAPIASPVLDRASTTVHLNVVNHVPLTAEVRTALTLAKLLSFSDGANPAASQARAAGALSTVMLQGGFSLLTAVATYRILEVYGNKPVLFDSGKRGLERLAVDLRVWVGSRSGKGAGFDRNQIGCVIERCLNVTKRIGGWAVDEGDSGYGSGLSRKGSDDTLIS